MGKVREATFGLRTLVSLYYHSGQSGKSSLTGARIKANILRDERVESYTKGGNDRLANDKDHLLCTETSS